MIEQRFADVLELNANDIPSIVLTTEEHRKFTNLWRDSIGYSRSGSKITTNTATKEVILEKVKEIYKDYPEMLKIIEEKLK